ncbi:MAG: rhombosortase [Victivallales bacterium]|jgi:rhomboid family GlyGly-CTERM serine protease|nr:rhombosortase [Victivallales bacterium]
MDTHRQYPVLIPALVVAALLAHAIPGVVGLLEYRAAAVASGEWWRLLTWHGVHWGPRHVFWDLVAFGILGSLCEIRSRRQTVVVLVLGAVVVSLAVRLVHQMLPSCRGLSGIDCALFALVWWLGLRQAMRNGRRGPSLLIGLAGVGFVAKTLYELAVAKALFAGGGFIPLPVSHLAGFAAGLLVAIAPGLWSRPPRWRAGACTAMVR